MAISQLRRKMGHGLDRKEAEWIDALRAGEPGAFARIYDEFGGPLCRFAIIYVGAVTEAEAVVQDCITRVWENRARLNINTGLAQYLFGAVRNRALNLVAKDKAAARLSEQLSLEAASGDSYDTIRSFDTSQQHYDTIEAAVAAAIEALPERCREVWTLKQGGLTYHQIAEVMGISYHTVNAQMGRALRLLRESLSAWRNISAAE